MPLAGLFQKRRSQKSKKSEIQPQEGNSKSVTESESVPSEINELLKELITKTVDMELSGNKTVESESLNYPISNSKEIETNHASNCKSNSVNPNDGEMVSKQDTNSNLSKQKRSVSESHFEVSSRIQPKGQRKFGSESNVLTAEGKLIPSKQRKEIDDAISKYVDKLIRDSIVKAVKNVDVDNLYKEIIKDYSNRRSSESADSVEDFVVEQRLTSGSISELVELESGDELSYENGSSISQDRHKKEPEYNSTEFEYMDHESFKGYLADYEDTTSVDDLKSFDEDSSVCSISDGLKNHVSLNNETCSKNSCKKSLNGQDNDSQCGGDEITTNDSDVLSLGKDCTRNESVPSDVLNEKSQETQTNYQQEHETSLVNSTSEEGHKFPSEQSAENQVNENTENLCSSEALMEPEKQSLNAQNCSEQEQKSQTVGNSEFEQESQSVKENQEQKEKQLLVDQKNQSSVKENSEQKEEQLLIDQKNQLSECDDLIVISPSDDYLITENTKCSESDNPTPPTPDIHENLPEQQSPVDEERKINWKVGYMHVKLPQKSRGKTPSKAWKKRCVAIQPDEFVNDPKNPSLVVSVYGAESRKHKATFWQSVSSQRAVVYRSSSRTHPYAFTISDEGRAIIHLSAESETATQEFMAAIRAVLWPPSPFMQLEKMLNGREFEISLIDNEFSYHAGLLGMYGYLTITPRKLILLHPQEGYVIQEWYLNTVDKFQLVPQPKAEDANKVLAMITCSDSSTGRGEMLLFCSEAVTLLQSLAYTIHQVLSLRSKQDGGGNRYQKELEEMAEWLVAPTQDSLNIDAKSEDHYKVPTRQVKSLLDIPNFIFEKTLSPVASAIYPAPDGDVLEPLETARTKPITTSHDSGISTCHSGEDFLNCSVTSFVVGGGPMTGKSSDSETSDTYTPPRSPERVKKNLMEKKLKEHLSAPKT